MESSWRPTTKQVAVLISLDLSAAFDTIDHRLLLDRLQLEFGVMEILLRWLQSYLEGWTQFIKMGQHKSHATDQMGVPQGPVLGPLSFAVYCSPIADVISHHGVQFTNTPTTCSSIWPCAPTTHPPGCPFSPSVPLMSDSGTCRTVYSSTRTSQKP